MILLTTWPFGAAANTAAWPALAAGGAALDAVEAVCRHVELDPAVDSVGWCGLPDRDGAMSLDGCVMLDPARVGSVCAYTHAPHPVSAARRVMEASPHVMLVGAGADGFAREQGLPAGEVLSDSARAAHASWRAAGGGPPSAHDTVAVLALDDSGTLAGACSTSGMSWKLPGRVGDSPIPGHGLYVAPGVGAAAATGHGELAMGSCVAFLAVEELRRGAAPTEAVTTALERVRASHALDADEQLGMIALAADGRWGHAALRAGYASAVQDATGGVVSEPERVLFGE